MTFCSCASSSRRSSHEQPAGKRVLKTGLGFESANGDPMGARAALLACGSSVASVNQPLGEGPVSRASPAGPRGAWVILPGCLTRKYQPA